jgi:hypothetical protein
VDGRAGAGGDDGHRGIDPAMASQFAMISPLLTILRSEVILGEPFTGWIAAGVVRVVASILAFSRATWCLNNRKNQGMLTLLRTLAWVTTLFGGTS